MPPHPATPKWDEHARLLLQHQQLIMFLRCHLRWPSKRSPRGARCQHQAWGCNILPHSKLLPPLATPQCIQVYLQDSSPLIIVLIYTHMPERSSLPMVTTHAATLIVTNRTSSNATPKCLTHYCGHYCYNSTFTRALHTTPRTTIFKVICSDLHTQTWLTLRPLCNVLTIFNNFVHLNPSCLDVGI